MKRDSLRSFIFGILATILVFSLIGTASATLEKKTIDVDYKNLKVKLDGEFLSLTDANGQTVEPFAYNGTTYLPVRAIANALGLDVDYLETRYPEAGTIILTRSDFSGVPASAPTPTPTPATAVDITVYLTSTGSKYHRSGCQYLSKSCYPISLADAQSRGYTVCSKCWY